MGEVARDDGDGVRRRFWDGRAVFPAPGATRQPDCPDDYDYEGNVDIGRRVVMDKFGNIIVAATCESDENGLDMVANWSASIDVAAWQVLN
jgi:hypothetical protein